MVSHYEVHVGGLGAPVLHTYLDNNDVLWSGLSTAMLSSVSGIEEPFSQLSKGLIMKI